MRLRRRQRGFLIVPTPWTPLERICLVAIFLFAASFFVALAAHGKKPIRDEESSERSATDPRVELGLVPPDVLEGARLFFEETFEGNGRTCGTCHLAESNLTITPDDIRRLAPDAPLFAPTVPGLERPELIERLGLILENVDGLDRAPVFRSVPHTLSLATSIDSNDPSDRGENAVGWSGDGAPPPGGLRDFATGAVRQHFTRSLDRIEGTDFRLPTDPELDALLAFQMTLGRTADIDLASARLADPAAERGRLMMLDTIPINCGRCHGNAGANRGDGSGLGNQSKDTGIDTLRARGLPPDDGRGTPGDTQFSPPPLIEAADTGPFFHVNTISDLEGAIRFYTTNVFTGAVQTFGEPGVADLAALLRALNVSLNAQMAIQRLDAAAIVDAFAEDDPSVERLLRLAAEEAADGARVLSAATDRATNEVRAAMLACESFAERAARHPRAEQRAERIARAREACAEADARLGTGLAMELGAGNLAIP